MNSKRHPKLERFVRGMDDVVARSAPEHQTLIDVKALMRDLVAEDDWLDDEFAVPHAQYYQQYLLHADAQGRYSVVSFVWGPGQKTPLHDHGVWGVIGMLRGQETAQGFEVDAGGVRPHGNPELLHPGDIAMVSPSIGDVHQVSNAFDDQVSISVHVYGTDIGKQKRHVFDATTGARKEFVSGYANANDNASTNVTSTADMSKDAPGTSARS